MEDISKKFDDEINKLKKENKESLEHIKEEAKSINNKNDQLIETIIANTLLIFNSTEMKKVFTSLESKFDKDIIGAITNLVVYASSAAAHQAITLYDELLHKELVT